ncbi:DNA-processing protein DprA [Sutcliffiella halmapala]|uniref:DNA-processing protein DprA n=1 Tax=Sutcliffiella halmapala TaxID=79882 RepID=UPI00099498DF|nr:DNA-processing protein DprA [Sutcliffiella halmapala]
MEAWKKRLITLHHCPQINNSSLLQLLKLNPNLDRISEHSPTQLAHLLRMPIKKTNDILTFLNTFQMDHLLAKYEERNIQTITIFDECYPPLLKEIFDPPIILYIKGDKTLLHSRCLGVVGTRNMSDYGEIALKRIIPPLINKGFSMVSGLARGIDTLAHTLSIKHYGRTIAVLGSGILQVYPKENQSLANQIATQHLLLSEYPPFTSPKKWHFPKRNRIISGLSEGVIIIEAKEKSGSLITADQALDQGREVFAIPGSIMSNTSTGTNSLIQQGAKLVMSYQDILQELK